MTLVRQFLRGALYSLAFLVAWFSAEGIYLALKTTDAPLWSFPFNLGVAAPLVLVLALIGACAFTGWAALKDTADPAVRLVDSIKGWLVSDVRNTRARRGAWLVGLPVLAAAWFLVAVIGGKPVLSTIKTPGFAVALLAIILLVAAGGLAVGASMLIWPLDRLLRKLDGAVPRGVQPASVVAGLLMVGLLGLAGIWALYPDVMPHLPWGFVLGPLAGLLTIRALMKWARAQRAAQFGAAGLAGLVALLGAFTLYLPSSLSEARSIFVGKTSPASVLYTKLDKTLDYDDDGAIHLYGENDCAPHDPKINPFAREIVANDVDENCSGADLSVDLAQFDMGKNTHPKPEGIVERPHILLVTTDALSHHHTTVGGYKRDTTPELKKWSDKATVFESGFALGSSTRLALPGLLAGTFNSMTPMVDARIHPFPWRPDTPTLATKLKRRGYKTIFVPGHDLFLPRRWKGFAHGFDTIDHEAWRRAEDKDHTAPAVTERVLEILEGHDDDEPLFLWVHYYDHHMPYETPEGHEIFEGDDKVDRFDNEVHYADKHWAQVFEAVEKKWRPEEYVMAFTADHGEAFDERHKHRHHGYTLDTPVLHVPFIIQAPEGRGERIDGLVTHADLPATLGNLAGVKPDETWIGESLVPVIFEGKEVEKDAAYALFYIPEAIKRGEDGFQKIVVRTQDYAYIEDLRKGHRRLLDWRRDPVGMDNLAEKQPETLEIYRYVAAKKIDWLRERESAISHVRKKKEGKKEKRERGNKKVKREKERKKKAGGERKREKRLEIKPRVPIEPPSVVKPLGKEK